MISWRGAVGAAGLVVLLLVPSAIATAQKPDSLLVVVRLDGVGSIMVMAGTEGSSLRLPAGPVYDLVGLGLPPLPEMTLDQLREELGVQVIWSPRQLQVLIRDVRQTLPASMARLDRLRALATTRAENGLQQSYAGPFGGLTLDDRGSALGELGYSQRWGQLRVSHSTRSGTSWSAAASPLSSLWLTYARSPLAGSRYGARLALEQGWVSGGYQMGRFGIEGAAALGPVVVYASSRDRFAITWRGSVDVQVGHTGERSALRVSFGPVDPSPVSVPMVF